MPLPVIDLYNTIFPKTKKARKAHPSGLCGVCGSSQALACSALMNCSKETLYLIIERDGIRLAVIGVVTPNIPVWDGIKEGVGDLTYEAPETAVKKAIAEIGDRADLIMVSAHMGEYAEFEDNGTDSGIRIVEENPEVDILQVGHMHVTVNDQINTTPAAGVRNAGREIVNYFAEHSPVASEADNNWKITGIDLNREDPRREEIIGWINDEKLPVPYNRSYNIKDYEVLAEEAKNK